MLQNFAQVGRGAQLQHNDIKGALARADRRRPERNHSEEAKFDFKRVVSKRVLDAFHHINKAFSRANACQVGQRPFVADASASRSGAIRT